MAFCPKCRGEMSTTDVACPHCGYDFPMPPAKKRMEDSPLADAALITGTVAAGLLSLGAVFQIVVAVMELVTELGRGEAWSAVCDFGLALFVRGLQFLLCFAGMVVFLRVSKLKS